MKGKEIRQSNEEIQEIQKTEVVLAQEEENPGVGIEIVIGPDSLG